MIHLPEYQELLINASRPSVKLKKDTTKKHYFPVNKWQAGKHGASSEYIEIPYLNSMQAYAFPVSPVDRRNKT
jgi:hypothetical protein